MWFWLPAIRVKKITVISNFSKSELIKIIPFAHDKIVVIPNPVDASIEQSNRIFNRKKPRILHIGTKANKNLERTIMALKSIECKLVVIGKLSEEQTILLSQSNIDYENYFFLNFKEIIAHYVNCDIVSFVSLYEGFGMPIIEAQKTGRAVITSNVASMPEVAGKGACLVNPLNVSEITNAVMKIVKDDDYREQLIESGFRNVKRFDSKLITEEYMKIYNQLLFVNS